MPKKTTKEKAENEVNVKIPGNIFGNMKIKFPKNKGNNVPPKQSPARSKSSSRCEMWDCDISQIIHLLTDIATNLWRAKKKNLDGTDNISDELRKTLRHYGVSWDLLINAGFEICDHTNEAYPEGSPLKVIAFQPMAGYGSLTVAETIKPTIYFNGKKLQEGEVVVAMPIKDDSNQNKA